MLSVVSHYTLKANNPHSTLPGQDFITFGSKASLRGQAAIIYKRRRIEEESAQAWEKEHLRSVRTSKEATRSLGLRSRGTRRVAGSQDN